MQGENYYRQHLGRDPNVLPSKGNSFSVLPHNFESIDCRDFNPGKAEMNIDTTRPVMVEQRDGVPRKGYEVRIHWTLAPPAV